MSRAGTIVWFARHEGRLAWRDWLWLMPGRRRSRFRVALGLIAIALVLHGFAYLAFYLRRAHPREVLAELLWPETPPEAARNSLSQALSSLRRRLEPPGSIPSAGRSCLVV